MKNLRICHALIGILVCLCFSTFSGCKKSSDSQLIPSGTLLRATDCKQSVARTGDAGAAIAAESQEDCLEYRYNGTDTLALSHINAGFNCCPGEIDADISFEGNIITITERESTAGCHCLCLYDLDYQIANLEPGEYTIRVIEPYISQTDQELEFTVTLSSITSGSFCQTRNSYPWVVD